jgi:hypothetical protein
MHRTIAKGILSPSLSGLGAVGLVILLAQTPACAGGDISNFKVKNCTTERMFVCSFDKTDGLMKIPYKAGGIQPGDKREFGCASIGRCKVIVGVSKRKTKKTLSEGMKAAMSTAAGGAGVIAVGSGGLFVATGMMVAETAALDVAIVAAGATSSIVALAAGGAVAGIEIADGWSDGEVCNQVRRAAEKAGMKPKDFMQDGKTYTVIAQYAANKDGNVYLNPDGTAVFAYKTSNSNACPSSLKTQLVPN